MKTLKFTQILMLLALMFSSSCTKTEFEKPNIILVMTDDQGYGDFGFTGNPIVKTPNIDAFSAQSVNLTNYHVGTTCTPTRAGLLTGRNCNRNGAWHTIMGASTLNRDEVTFADVLEEDGYKTGMFGKWHLGDNHPFSPQARGFQETYYLGGGGIGQTPDYWQNDYFDDTYRRNGKPEKAEGYCTDVFFSEAIKFIERHKAEPFFCYLSLNAPHSPFNVPEEYYNIYKDETDIMESQKRFYGMITNIDDNFIKLQKKLEELEIADNTILIFTTDNGSSNGYKINKETMKMSGYNAGMRGTKASQYDGGHRVPFIVHWKNGGLTGGKQLNELTAHVDVLPTLAALAGINYTSKKEMDGTDISPYLLKGEAPAKRMLVTDTQRVAWPIKGKQSCVMQDYWRLVNGDELYNVKDDPGQESNIADQYPERVKAMNDFYDTWWESVIKESKYSVIDLGVDEVDVLTCMDIKSKKQLPNWNQRMIREGGSLTPAPFSVNFVKTGKYRISLRRWPAESNTALGAPMDDALPETAYTDPRVYGKALDFRKAHLEIADASYEIDADNTALAASFEVDAQAGNTDLTAWFEMSDGTPSNAFYIYVELLQ